MSIAYDFSYWQTRAEKAEAVLAEMRALSAEYIRRTDPLVTCAAWVHGGEREKQCGECRSCVIDQRDAALSREQEARTFIRDRQNWLHANNVKGQWHDRHFGIDLGECNSLLCVHARAFLAKPPAPQGCGVHGHNIGINGCPNRSDCVRVPVGPMTPAPQGETPSLSPLAREQFPKAAAIEDAIRERHAFVGHGVGHCYWTNKGLCHFMIENDDPEIGGYCGKPESDPVHVQSEGGCKYGEFPHTPAKVGKASPTEYVCIVCGVEVPAPVHAPEPPREEERTCRCCHKTFVVKPGRAGIYCDPCVLHDEDCRHAECECAPGEKEHVGACPLSDHVANDPVHAPEPPRAGLSREEIHAKVRKMGGAEALRRIQRFCDSIDDSDNAAPAPPPAVPAKEAHSYCPDCLQDDRCICPPAEKQEEPPR